MRTTMMPAPPMNIVSSIVKRIGRCHNEPIRVRPQAAKTEIQAVLDAVPENKAGVGRSFARQAAAYAMARVKAEQGDFKAAVEWLERAPSEYWSGCGNCMQGEQVWGHPKLVVWKAAQVPDEEPLQGKKVALAASWLALSTPEVAEAVRAAARVLAELGATIGDALLAPHRSYLACVAPLLEARLVRWKGVFRTVLFLPVVTTLVAIAVVAACGGPTTGPSGTGAGASRVSG